MDVCPDNAITVLIQRVSVTHPARFRQVDIEDVDGASERLVQILSENAIAL